VKSSSKNQGTAALRKAMVEICHRLAAKGFVSAMDGNVSARLPDGNILTTRTNVDKSLVAPTDLVVVDIHGRLVRGKHRPSTELPMHLFIYNKRKDAGAVVHAHPPFATAFAAARIPFPSNVFPEVILGLGYVPLADYATPATEEIPKSLAPHIEKSSAILLANHGAVTLGKDLWQAYYRMEKLEHAARTLLYARLLGGEKRLSELDLQKLLATHPK